MTNVVGAQPPGPPPAAEPPEITGIEPSAGSAAGGYPITISGRNLGGTLRVTIHGHESTVFSVKHPSQQVVAFVPRLDLPQQQLVDVYVTTPGGHSKWGFTATPVPEVTSVEPIEITTTTWLKRTKTRTTNRLKVTGRHLEGASAVFFESAAADDPGQAQPPSGVRRRPGKSLVPGEAPGTELTVERPAGPAGPTRVTVVTPGGTSDPFDISFPADKSQRWIFLLQMFYMLALIVGLVLYNNLDEFRQHLSNPLGPIPLGIPWFGALGAVTLSVSGLVDHRDDWDRAYVYWHISRPVIGIAFALAAYFAFAAGVLASNGTPQNAPATAATTVTTTVVVSPTPLPSLGAASYSAALPVQTAAPSATPAPSGGGSSDGGRINNLFYYILAFVVGFREETFRGLIKRVSDVLLGPGTTNGTGQRRRGEGGTTSPGTPPTSPPTTPAAPTGPATPAPTETPVNG